MNTPSSVKPQIASWRAVEALRAGVPNSDAVQALEMIADQRRQLADVFDGLDASQWTTPSLCEGWTIREIAGHLISPHALGTTKMLLHFAGSGFNFDKYGGQSRATVRSAPDERVGSSVANPRRVALDTAGPGGRGAIWRHCGAHPGRLPGAGGRAHARP